MNGGPTEHQTQKLRDAASVFSGICISMELFPLHCDHSGCISRFHALMGKERHKTEAEFYSLIETPHAEAAKNRSWEIQPSGNVVLGFIVLG